MKKLSFSVVFILLILRSFAIYHGENDYVKDTVYIGEGKIAGYIIDIKQNKVAIKTDSKNTILIPFSKIERIYFSKKFVPQVLLNQKITFNGQKLNGRILYYDILKSDILFLDAKKNQVIRIPLLETSLADKNIKKLYKSSSILSIFLSLGIIAEIITKIFTPIVIYLIATFLLLIVTLILFRIFVKAWHKHKQRHKK